MSVITESPVVIPSRSLTQRLAALELANEIRFHRSQVKRELAAGRIHLSDLLDDPMCETMRVWDAMVALPKIGRVKANRALVRMRISPSKALGGLSSRQRRELLEVLS